MVNPEWSTGATVQLIIAAPSLLANLGVIIKIFLDNKKAATQRQELSCKIDDVAANHAETLTKIDNLEKKTEEIHSAISS